MKLKLEASAWLFFGTVAVYIWL